MQLIRTLFIAIAAVTSSTMALAGHSELKVPPADTFMLGGDQAAPMRVSGRNNGETVVAIAARRGSTDTVIATVQPGSSFSHDFAVGETALIRNESAKAAASLSVDFTGSPAELSMKYALPQKN